MADLHIADLLDLEYLEAAIEAGLVRVQQHPTEPLGIYNYTERCAYEQAWSPVTLTCRGLIVDANGWVKARPLRKFFNFGDPMAGELDASAKAVVVDKLDGSLGILYPSSAGWAIATRGSFASGQALHATEVLGQRYLDFTPPEGVTVLWEIIYPENRIVCDYGGADDLFLLGGVEISTGRVLSPDEVPGWPGPSATVFNVPTLADALAMPPRPRAEGLVVRLIESGEMVKLKQADYMALHKILSGLNARGVWELLGAGKTVADICEPLPDEFHSWVRNLAGDLQREAAELLEDTERYHEKILARLPEGWTRKDYAIEASTSTLKGWLFMLLDERDPRPHIWRTLRPSGDMRPVQFDEDAA